MLMDGLNPSSLIRLALEVYPLLQNLCCVFVDRNASPRRIGFGILPYLLAVVVDRTRDLDERFLFPEDDVANAYRQHLLRSHARVQQEQQRHLEIPEGQLLHFLQESGGVVCHQRVDERLALLEDPREELRLRRVLSDIFLLKRVVHHLAQELEYLRLHVGAGHLDGLEGLGERAVLPHPASGLAVLLPCA